MRPGGQLTMGSSRSLGMGSTAIFVGDETNFNNYRVHRAVVLGSGCADVL